MDAAIDVQGLRKVYKVADRGPGIRGAVASLFRARSRDVIAVDDVSFRIQRGERVAFVGPNGAGKSTTIKVLSGILHPSAGSVQVLGLVPWRQRRELGYQIGTVFGQRSQLWYHLPAADTFALLARVYDRDPIAHAQLLASYVEIFEIGALLHKPVRQLSLGERMRCEVVASLLHQPEVLFLDEPTIGLDVSAKAVIRDLIREQSLEDGRTLLFTSHDTGDMERVCDRVIVINRGRLLLDQPVSQLRREFIGRKRITVHSREPTIELPSLPGVTAVSPSSHVTRLEVDVRRTGIERVVQEVLRCSRIDDLCVEDPPMEEIVQAIYANANPGGPSVDRLGSETSP